MVNRPGTAPGSLGLKIPRVSFLLAIHGHEIGFAFISSHTTIVPVSAK